jgi:AcrR family transcriptional regulator
MQPIFAPTTPLPRGPHQLSREEVALSQRMRLMAAFTELLAKLGYSAVTIGELTRVAGVSRAAFYEHFTDKEACLFAAYDHFAASLITAMTANVDEGTPWDTFIGVTLDGYLGTLQDDPTAARAFLVEMDGAGRAARERRSIALDAFSELLRRRHEEIRAQDPSLGPLPARVHRGLVLGVRELVREALEEESTPQLTAMTPDIVLWISAAIEGAEAARRHARD